MDKVLDIGVDGFKCDGTDPIRHYLNLDLILLMLKDT
jgi:hypothetical protein